MRQPPARSQAQVSAACGHLLSNGRIIVRRGHNRHVAKILGRGAHHRRPADIDILDDLVKMYSWFSGGLFKGVKVHHHHVDRLNPMLARRRHVCCIVPDMQDAPVDFRVKGLHPPIHHLRKAGKLGDVFHRNTCIAQQLGRASSRDQLDFQAGQFGGKLNNPSLIGNAQNSALNLRHSRFPQEKGFEQKEQIKVSKNCHLCAFACIRVHSWQKWFDPRHPTRTAAGSSKQSGTPR